MTLDGAARLGHTRIAPAALRHALEAVAAGAFGIGPADVSATLQDDAGRLGVDLVVRFAPPLLPGPAGQEQHPVFERASIARLKISSLGRQVTGMECGRINIRIAGASQAGRKSRLDQATRVDRRKDRRTP